MKYLAAALALIFVGCSNGTHEHSHKFLCIEIKDPQSRDTSVAFCETAEQCKETCKNMGSNIQ